MGRSWSHLGTIRSQDRKPGRSTSMVFRVWGRFWLPKWVPKRPQDDPKTNQTSRRKMHDVLIALGSVLDRSWGDLEPVLGAFLAISHWFFQCFLNIVIFEQMTVQDAFWVQLDSIWPPKRVPRGAQDEPKTDPKRVQNRVKNRSEKMIDKWTAQSSISSSGPHTFGSRGPPGGG